LAKELERDDVAKGRGGATADAVTSDLNEPSDGPEMLMVKLGIPGAES